MGRSRTPSTSSSTPTEPDSVNVRSGRVRMHLWPEAYTVARLRSVPTPVPGAGADGSPVSLTVGHGEVSLVAPEGVVAALADEVETSTPGWRLLTLDVKLPFDVVGLLAAVATALAQVRVPVIVVSSHDTDHFLVPEAKLGVALAAISQVPLEGLLPPS